MKSQWVGVLCVNFVCSLLAANVLAATGAQVDITALTPCPSYCGGPGGQSDSSTDGGVGDMSAATSLSAFGGTGAGTANLSDLSYLPTLGAEAYSGSDSRMQTDATGSNSYVYDGPVPTTITLDVALDGEVGDIGGDFDESVVSYVVVVKGMLESWTTSSGTILELTPPEDIIDLSVLSLDKVTGEQTLNDSLVVSLNPGDQFYVWAGLTTHGIRGGFGDALNTLTMSFSDSTGLTPEVVPIPAAAWLFGSAIVGLLGIARRREVGRRRPRRPVSGLLRCQLGTDDRPMEE